MNPITKNMIGLSCPSVNSQTNIYFYEIHITVDNKNLNFNLFNNACKLLKVKPLQLELYPRTIGFDTTIDVMTSSIISDTLKNVITYKNNIVKQLQKNSFKIIRQKIETVPHFCLLNGMKNNYYFETHFDILTTDLIDSIVLFSNKHSLDLSKNINKNNRFILTYKNKTLSYDQYIQMLLTIKLLIEKRYKLIHAQTELIIFDTQTNYDIVKLNNKSLSFNNIIN